MNSLVGNVFRVAPLSGRAGLMAPRLLGVGTPPWRENLQGARRAFSLHIGGGGGSGSVSGKVDFSHHGGHHQSAMQSMKSMNSISSLQKYASFNSVITRKCSSKPNPSKDFDSVSTKSDIVDKAPFKTSDTPDYHPDGLTRYPSYSSANGLLRALDWLVISYNLICCLGYTLLNMSVGTVSFAASGTIVAGYAGMDSLGCTIVGAITATGGGTIRDILLGSTPVFWVVEVEYLWLVLVTVGVTFLLFDKRLAYPFGENGVILYVTDTLGLGAFSVIGAQNAIRMGLPAVVCVACGMITATFGGIMRDILCCKPVRIVHSHAEIYSVTAISGASVYVALRHLGLPPALRILGGVFSAVAMRHWATKYNITLPVASWFNPNKQIQQGNAVILLQKDTLPPPPPPSPSPRVEE